MFVVIRHFTDTHDRRHSYNAGDTYPREGYTPTKARINELSGYENSLCTPLIKFVEEKKAAEDGTNHSDRQLNKRNNRRTHD